MFKLDEILDKVKELHSHSILNNNEYYTEKLLQIIIDLSTIDNQSLDNLKSEVYEKEIEKVKRKVPKWMKKKHQYNYRILKVFMDISNHNEHSVSVDELEKYSEIDPKIFLGHYNGMKTISVKNHGKVFDEVDKKVKLWEPVAEFIEVIFEENSLMDKKNASNLINNNLGTHELNSSNNGNVKWANINSTKNVYWINIHIDYRIKGNIHFILNDENKRQFIHMKIPPNIFIEDLFICRLDKTNGLDKYDIELSNHKVNYLHDIKSGSSNFDFTKYVVKVYKY